MLGRLILLFLLTPAVELGLLIQVDKLIGFWPTIGLIIATGIAGSYFARREGTSAWRRLNKSLAEGGLPGKELLDGVIILVAGALLITPGVLTDVFGFMGLIPPTRALIRKLIMSRVKKKMNDGSLKMQFGFFGGGMQGGFDAGDSGDFPGGGFDGPGGRGDGGTDPQGPHGGGSEVKREGDARWEGSSRKRPSHVDELGEPSSGSEESNRV